jgi:hypothetical protein
MIMLHWFHRKDDRYAMAVTPDDTGSVLPSGEWQCWHSQPVHPEQAIEGCGLADYLAAIGQVGYYLYPRNGSMKAESIATQ